MLQALTIIIAIIISIIGITLTPHTLPTIFPKYAGVVDSIQILSIAVIPITISFIITSQLLGAERSRIVLIGDAAFAVRPHAAAGTAKACADGWGLSEALQSCNGDIKPALAEWESNQIALGRQLLDRTRLMGDRSQFKHDWFPGDPTLKLGLYGPGR